MAQELLPYQDQPILATIALLEQQGLVQQNGLILPPGLSYEEYEAIGRGLWLAREALQFLIGDWINYGENEYEGDIYVQAAHMTGAADQTLRNWSSTARTLPPQRRQPVWKVRHSIQAEVAKRDLKAADQRRILKRAAEEGLSRLQVRDLVREARGEPAPKVEPDEACPTCGRAL